jgi:CheY-like chemotaxis protein
MLKRLLGEDVTLRFSAGKELGHVMADQGQMEQVLVNLSVNARDSMPAGGTLAIETANVDLDEEYCAAHAHARPGSFVVLAVSDTGVGMSQEVKKRLFEPFFTTKPQGKGTGLGLATTFGAVTQAGGRIEVYSEPGRGSTFRIYLPRTEAGAPAPGPVEHPPSFPRGAETILLVEDEVFVRSFALKILGRLGYEVLAAANAEEALAAARGHPGSIDLLMTDVVMPGMDGRQLSERLLRERPLMKVLFTSGYTADVILDHGVAHHAAGFLSKPYTLGSLARKIRKIIDGGRER